MSDAAHRLILDPAGPYAEAGRPKAFPRWWWLILEEGLPGYVAAVKADDEPTVRRRAQVVLAALQGETGVESLFAHLRQWADERFRVASDLVRSTTIQRRKWQQRGVAEALGDLLHHLDSMERGHS